MSMNQSGARFIRLISMGERPLESSGVPHLHNSIIFCLCVRERAEWQFTGEALPLCQAIMRQERIKTARLVATRLS